MEQRVCLLCRDIGLFCHYMLKQVMIANFRISQGYWRIELLVVYLITLQAGGYAKLVLVIKTYISHE